MVKLPGSMRPAGRPQSVVGGRPATGQPAQQSGAGGSGTAPAGETVFNVTTQSFMKDVVEASKSVPVLVDFWAPWCGPCRQLTPVLEKVVRAAKGKIRLAKMNIDEHPGVAGQLGVQSIPAVFAFIDGRPVDGFMGALPESQVKNFIDRLLAAHGGDADGVAELLESARELFNAGDLKGAAEIYGAIIEEESDNVEALAGLAQVYVKSGDLQQAETTLALVPPAKQGHAAVATARANLELARKAPVGKEAEALAARLAKDANDHQARYDLALAMNAAGRREEALEHLLEIMRRNRAWNDEAARKQLVQLFEAWGPKDAMTLKGRKQLSALLFA